ncbi:glutamate-tRNA ligase [Chiua virens]|nr:glutamate-tRNA ligase [Chiua virens]
MSLTLPTKASPFPYASLAIATYTQKADLNFDETAAGVSLNLNDNQYTSEEEIVRILAKIAGISEESTKEPIYFALAKTLATITGVPDILNILDSLDDHLAYHTFLADNEITGADWILWGTIRASIKTLGLLKNGQHVHALRWFSYFESLESTQAALASIVAAKANKARNSKTAASFALGLQNAKEGEVVTRFPPEPSGYLHIGKMIVRFDDTNPTKERTEFEQTILEDLELMGIKGDTISHTSDYFDQIYDFGIKMIQTGKAYTDDTEQTQMREERGKGIASAHREDSVKDNLMHFAEMRSGTPEGLRWCLRAKISVDDQNKTLRDPVIYRCNVIPHHRTGQKWKIYPTYDFACPIVDALEGVSHALRTMEYRERNAQYYWMIEALDLRPVLIWDFSRLNFIYTLLSKRKLHWFVDNKIVKGWDDPRFPTVRGIRRRGMTVEALKQFMLTQGPSQSLVSLEWDSIWALNKKVIDPVAPRFWAIIKEKCVRVTINGGPTGVEVKRLPLHKKNPEVGEKQTVYSSAILLEQEDAASFEDQEEITFMDWGNAFVRSKEVGEDGEVTSLVMELNLDGDFRKTKKKITWLAEHTDAHPLIEVNLLDYDYLITKKKLEEEDDVRDFVPPVTEFCEEALADANVKTLKSGDIIQFERKGYFIFDGLAENGKLQFIKIPDGRAAGVASKAGKGVVSPEAGGFATPPTGADFQSASKMYKVDRVYGEEDVLPASSTKMYRVENV